MPTTPRSKPAVRARVAALVTPGVEIVDCDPTLADTAAFCAAYGYAMEDSANAIVVIGKSEPPRFALCLVLATTRLDVNKAVRARLGTRKASFAPAETTTALTGMTIGGVTPFAVPDGLPIWVDAAVMSATASSSAAAAAAARSSGHRRCCSSSTASRWSTDSPAV